MAEQGN